MGLPKMKLVPNMRYHAKVKLARDLASPDCDTMYLFSPPTLIFPCPTDVSKESFIKKLEKKSSGTSLLRGR